MYESPRGVKEIPIIQKSVISNQFISIFSTVWKNEKFSITEKILCLVKAVVSRNFCQKSVRESKFPKFPHFYSASDKIKTKRRLQSA